MSLWKWLCEEIVVRSAPLSPRHLGHVLRFAPDVTKVMDARAHAPYAREARADGSRLAPAWDHHRSHDTRSRLPWAARVGLRAVEASAGESEGEGRPERR